MASTVARMRGMSRKSNSGSTPCENRFIATVTMSQLPVRSPLPNSVPSTRWAPAISASSVAATPVPRSLCVCRLMTMRSRPGKRRANHSIWSAYTLGVAISTVEGRLTMMGCAGVAPHSSATAAQMSTAKSSSVPVKLSGEYSNTTLVPRSARTPSFTTAVPCTAKSTMPARSMSNTTRRCSSEVEL